jgi:hypothetical protein
MRILDTTAPSSGRPAQPAQQIQPIQPAQPNVQHRLHAERTSDPATMRWVVHGCTAGLAGGQLDRLVHRGLVRSFTTDGTDVLITATDPQRWSSIAREVHRAVTADLARDGHLAPASGLTATPVAWGRGADRDEPRATGCSSAGVSGACRSCPSAR